ncbi:MAG: alanine--tRNA ligase [Candidatus Pacebacteria bacterium]|nr:alanine--tRNA ligase [Candidatus Paceibacterota bacterium]
MTANEIREKYLKFFESKGHKIIPSASLIPENDPTVLFTTAGMHPLVPYLLGEKHPMGKRLCNSQKCIRTGDIDDVGDATHLTFFEMLGNWSLGDYFKKEAIEWSFEFLIKELKIPLEKLAVSVFKGEPENNIQKDDEAAEIWQSLGVSKERIAYLGREDNWWGPAGATGPCGPDTEMFYWTGSANPPDGRFDSNDKRWVEIWNDVFMQYNKTADGKFEELSQKNVDTGMGLERVAAVLQGKDNVYETELFEPILETIKELSKGEISVGLQKEFRQIGDHIKAATFILAERLEPSNTGRGYILRRLLRRAIRNSKFFKLEKGFTIGIARSVIDIYQGVFPEVLDNSDFIFEQMEKEEELFEKPFSRIGLYRSDLQMAIQQGVIKKINQKPIILKPEVASGEYVYENYQSYGVPPDLSQEIIKELGLKFDQEGFDKAFLKHQELSRTASAGQFKSGLADNSQATTKYHTATHLLLAALRTILGPEVEQRGSNITAERIRFDFSFPRKMSNEEIKNVENIVNQKIKQGLEVVCEEKKTEQAKQEGAAGVFGHKYGDRVKVFTIGQNENVCSKEICAGPHVKNTAELGEFKIVKEEASSAGVRRIKAVLQ